MTEDAWLAASVPWPMLFFLRDTASDRKLRLFASACCWTLERVLCDEALHLIDLIERYADGMAGLKELTEARRNALNPSAANTPTGPHYQDEVSQSALRVAVLAAWGKVDPNKAIDDVVKEALYTRRRMGFKFAPAQFAGLCRDIFNPFRSAAFNPRWVSSTVAALATGIYDECAFDRMPVLADALEDEGCEDAGVLAHCRDDGSHVRGCWVVDLVLGKE